MWVLLVGLSVLGCLLMLRGDQKMTEQLLSQRAAQRWETEEKPYAQATVFLQQQDAIPQDTVAQIRLNVENAMLSGGVAAEEYPWLYAFSRTQQAELINGIAGSTVEMTLVTGDYFQLHPLTIRSGWYFSDSEVMRDRIILDRQTAWELFYSDNVVGQFLEWNGYRYMVAAVVETEPGEFNRLAAENVQRAWVLADSPGADTTQGFTCVEMVLPQPVEGFAVSVMQSVLDGYLPEGTVALDNTGRFSLINRWNALRTISTRWISAKAIAYPYYENAARLMENRLALRLIPEGILAAFACISAVVWLLMLNSRRSWGLHSIPEAIERAVERKRTRDYEARLRGEERKDDPIRRRKTTAGRERKARGSIDPSGRKRGIGKRR